MSYHLDDKNEEFGRVYDEHVVRIYRFIYLKVSSQEVAEDLASEVFIRAYQEFQNSRVEHIQAYLYQIARNLVIDHYRSPERTRVVSIEQGALEVQDGGGSLQEQAGVSWDMERVRRALSELKDDYQNYVILRYLEELSVPEVAKIMGKSEQSVRTGTHRALKTLQERLGEQKAVNV